jgi:UDP-2,3-diacylglucosamine pyrophosphatase LpxH
MSLHTFISNPIPIQREIAKVFARFIRPDDKACFNELWELHRQQPDTDEFEEREKDAVEREFTRLAAAMANKADTTIKRLPLNGRYVIFSDLHTTPAGHRHDYFRTFGNHKLYALILLQYFLKGYTVIENGDAEDLLVPDPTLAEAKEMGRLNLENKMQELETLRLNRRAAQLTRILNSYDADKYKPHRLLADSFFTKNRFYRTIGNHDDDLVLQRFDTIMTEWLNKGHATQTPFKAYKSIVIEDTNGSPRFVITHGNQFDKGCTPETASVSGELHSECLAWAYEGADRVWRWQTHSSKWATQGKTFLNRLVSDTAAPITDSVKTLINRIGTLNSPDDLLNLFRGAPDEVIRAVIENLTNQTPIAWEYLAGNTALEKLKTVLDKKEFFKYRHTNEIKIARRWKELFPSATPTLILGHTHEVRMNPVRPDGSVASWYMNCGSAGRFENLIWGIEIDNGTPRLVSWHFSDGPSGEKTVRLVYHNSPTNEELIPSATHQPL